MAGSREHFLRGAFARLHAEGVEYCVSRNTQELFRSTTSDVDLVVPPGLMARVEELFALEAELHGYRQIARIEFTNVCLVYWAPGAEFVRIDLDGELRWYWFEIADAETLLEGAARADGVVVISPRAEWFVLADRLAWRGALPSRYKHRVEQLQTEEEKSSYPSGSLLEKFLARDDSRGLRLHLIRGTLLSPRKIVRALRHLMRDTGRMIRRAVAPPGVFLRVSGQQGGMEWQQLFRAMSMAFPEAKCVRLGASPLPGLSGLFRGGLVVADGGHPFAASICEAFSARNRRLKVVEPSCDGHDDLVIPPPGGRTEAFADMLAATIHARR